MKKFITIAGLFCVTLSLHAAKGDQTREEYIAKEKAKWAENGWRWNQEKVESNFLEVDVNKDGIASGLERKVWFEKKAAEIAAKKKAAEKAGQ